MEKSSLYFSSYTVKIKELRQDLFLLTLKTTQLHAVESRRLGTQMNKTPENKLIYQGVSKDKSHRTFKNINLSILDMDSLFGHHRRKLKPHVLGLQLLGSHITLRCLGQPETLLAIVSHLKSLFLVQLWFTGCGQFLSSYFWCHIIWLDGESWSEWVLSVPFPSSDSLFCPSGNLLLSCPGSATVTPRYPQLKRHPAVSVFF